jgi:chromosome segregation ATPase
MKGFLQNLLVFFALALCAVMIFQWVREAHMHQQLESFATELHHKAETIRDLQGTVKRTEDEVKRLEGIKEQLTATVKANQQEILALKKDLQKVEAENERNLRQSAIYKEALDKANENLKIANENIQKQNEEMKKLAQLANERNEMVEKYNKVVQEFNDLAEKWNKLQEGGKTNAPSKK